MEYRNLGNSSLQTSVIGLGTLHFGVYCDQSLTNRIVHQAVDSGINFFDTAPMYGQGNSEKFLSNALEKFQRDSYLISTKVGLEPIMTHEGIFGVREIKLTKENIIESVEKSLQHLSTDYIDLLQLHAFDYDTSFSEILEAIAILVKDGKIRYFGCSNYSPDELNNALSEISKTNIKEFASVQCHVNVIERRAFNELIPLCEKSNLGVICNRALARGILSGKYKSGEEVPEGSRAHTSLRIKRLLNEDTLKLVSGLDGFIAQYDKSLVEMAIAWLISSKPVSSILLGVRNNEQLESCLSSLQFKLESDDLDAIDDVISNLGYADKVRSLPEVFLEK